MSITISKPSAETPSSGITWGPWAAIIVVVLIFVLAQLFGFELTRIYPELHHWNLARTENWLNNSIIAQFVYVLLAEGLSVLALFGFIRWRKGSVQAIGLKRAKWEDIAYALIGFAVYFVIYIVIVGVLTTFIKGLNVNQQQALGFSQSTTGWQLMLVLLSLVVLPPLVEEIMFRGFLYSGLKKALPAIWAIIVTSLIFASPHLLESGSGGLLWIAGIDTFVLSCVLCSLREKTGRLYAGMLVHGLKNFIAFASLFLLHVH